ncbi:MAG: substrate-binding domain-containing protein, partial [Herpetosiphonaceae bacterium]|nr:substrate-binding domain-containing protein [Herpetosiphonaceae bacterium]
MLDHSQSPHYTIGVLSNRQIYEGTTIVRYEQMLFRGIRAAAHAYNANLLLACGMGPGMIPFERRSAWPVSLPDADFVPVGPWNTSGLIVVPPLTEVQLSLIQTWVTQEHPFVFTAPQEGYPAVGPANSAGITAAFDHLIAHGHRRIAFIAGHEHQGSDDAERLAAYRSAVVAHGLPVDNTLVAFGDHVANESYRVMRRLLKAAVQFTAVLTSNDESAIGALQALADAGKRVPQDVAVIGFDDVLYAKAQAPPLTTIRHPTFELGYGAVELLIDYMTGRRTAVTTVRVPTRLIIRESCGCQPYCTPLVVARDGGKAARSVGTDFDQAALVQAMADAASAELHHDSTPLISARCRSLVAGFLTSLHDDDPQPFGTALEQILQLGDATNEDAYAWQAAISVLREQGVAVLLAAATAGTHAQAECLIDQARVRISERLRRHHIQLQMRQAKLTDRLGTLTTGLLTALEPRQILQILAEQLPQLDIRHAHIALFAAEDNDPVPWSDLYIHVPGEAPVIRRFPSRHFPPPGLYNSAKPYSLALLPLIIEGGPSGFVAFDAAYLEPYGFIVRHLAAALRNSQLHAAAEAGRQLAEESSRLKSRFLATVSHELRMPLNLVVGLSEMLLREHTGSQALPQSVVQDLERIYGNAEHLGRMIGDVLDLASSEAGQLRLNREPLDLAEVLAVVAVTGAQMAQAKGLAWHTRLPTDGVQVWGDRTRLRQVVLNLISNAVKFTERGSVTLELSLA